MGFVLLQGLEFWQRERYEALPKYVPEEAWRDGDGLEYADAAVKRKNWGLERASQRVVAGAGHTWSAPCLEGSAGVIAGFGNGAS